MGESHQSQKGNSINLPAMRLLWPVTVLNLCFTVLGSATEQFDERLTLRTLQDGRIASKFTFTTLLKGASPRDPKTLDASDECEWHFLSRLPQSESWLDVSSALYSVSSCSGSDLARVCCFGTPSYTERWKLELWSVGVSWRERSWYRCRAMGMDGPRNNYVSQWFSLTIETDRSFWEIE